MNSFPGIRLLRFVTSLPAIRRHLLSTILFIAPLSAQNLVTDATYSLRLSSQSSSVNNGFGSAARYNFSGSLGLMHQLSPTLSIGGVATGGTWGEFYLGAGPRIAVHPSRDLTLNLTPSLLLIRGGEPNKSRLLLDASAMYQNKIGVSFQATTFNQYHYSSEPFGESFVTKKTMFYGGVRLGSKPGIIGLLVDGAALGAAFLWILILCNSGGCD